MLAGAALALGAAHAFLAAAGHVLYPDAVSYLDMGDAYFRRDVPVTPNGYWSPLYAWILGAAVWLVEPSPAWEVPFFHAVNFGLYGVALACFGFFWSVLLREIGHPDGEWNRGSPLPTGTLLMLGYALFAWSSLYLVQVFSGTPDMLVAAVVYLATALLLRVRLGHDRPGTYLLLGAVLGLGYLAKAVLFLVAPIFIGAAAVSAPRRRRRAVGALAGILGFSAVASPWIVALSLEKQRLTYGETGRLNYAWYVNDVPRLHWQGDVPDHGTPDHPTRLLLSDPPTFEFGSPVGGTYPPWYDPSYWYEGLRVEFRPGAQLGVLVRNALEYFEWFVRQLGPVFAALALLHAGARSWRRTLRRYWVLVLPAAVVFSLYALVHVEGRFLGPFVVLLVTALLAGARSGEGGASRRLVGAVTGLVGGVLLLNILTFSVKALRLPTQPSNPWRVAAALQATALGPGDPVAYVGETIHDAAWARLARLRVVAEAQPPDSDGFWADPQAVERVLEAFCRSGARGAIAPGVPGRIGDGWRRLGDTRLSYRALGSECYGEGGSADVPGNGLGKR